MMKSRDQNKENKTKGHRVVGKSESETNLDVNASKKSNLDIFKHLDSEII